MRVLGFWLYLKWQNNSDIPNDYIAIFHGGVGEQTYETYIYKIIYLLIKRRREIFKIKENFNEQSSNHRIVENINVQH